MIKIMPWQKDFMFQYLPLLLQIAISATSATRPLFCHRNVDLIPNKYSEFDISSLNTSANLSLFFNNEAASKAGDPNQLSFIRVAIYMSLETMP